MSASLPDGYAEIVAASLNVAGAAGDAIIARAVLSHPSDARFEDTGEGLVVS